MGGAVLADALPHAALPEGPPRLQPGRHAGLPRLAFAAMNPPDGKLEKVAMALGRAMRYPITLGFRQFYARNTSSDEFGE
mgnify:CR=1 FL=1